MAHDRAAEMLQQHLQDVVDHPDTSLDHRLLEQIDSDISENLKRSRRSELLDRLSKLLLQLPTETDRFAQLIGRLIAPASVTFDDILKIQPQIPFEAGLGAPTEATVSVTLRILAKATSSISHTQWVANQRQLVASLLDLWLKSSDTHISTLAEDVLVGLLLAGNISGAWGTTVEMATCDNYMYKRVFRDQNIYEMAFHICSLSNIGRDGLTMGIVTTAQGRLLNFLLRIRNAPVRTIQSTEVEARYGIRGKQGEPGGWWTFALQHMIDKSDELMLVTYLEFCSRLLTDSPTGTNGAESAEMVYLRGNGIHEDCMSYLIAPRPNELELVTNASIRYIATYLDRYPRSARLDSDLLDHLSADVVADLEKVGRQQSSKGTIPTPTLLLLVSLPPEMLLGEDLRSCLRYLNLKAGDANVINTLGEIFGKHSETEGEQAARRASYFLYQNVHRDLWTSIVTAASTVVDLDVALAALGFMRKILGAKWSLLPDEKSLYEGRELPSETSLEKLCTDGRPLPRTGLEAFLLQSMEESEPMQFLFTPGPYSRGWGDETRATSQIRNAKSDLRYAVRKLLQGLPQTDATRSYLRVVDERIQLCESSGAAQLSGEIATQRG